MECTGVGGMRVTSVMVAVVVALLGLTAQASAQAWDQFTFPEDGFKVDFPGKPTLTETTYTSEYGAALPAKVYRATRGAEKYSATVVDYTVAPKLLDEKARAALDPSDRIQPLAEKAQLLQLAQLGTLSSDASTNAWMTDGEALCHTCAQDNYRLIAGATLRDDDRRSGWDDRRAPQDVRSAPGFSCERGPRPRSAAGSGGSGSLRRRPADGCASRRSPRA